MTIANMIANPPVVFAAGTPRPTVEFSVIIPFRNPGSALRHTVQRITDALYAQNVSFQVIAVAADCTDGSELTLTGLHGTWVSSDPDIRDRGAALTYGFAAAVGAWIGFVDIDADTEVDPYELVECLHRARESERVDVLV
ncbi:glycosyltransferase [Actinoplanes sp. ATCC 53533]|uniref:glycosyltransferase n=1 Tax=Actinoplanes sp. ATCC 53533 TaxID=1288362 RepID=UPI0013159676|nr:glycosyltransferase [Actinoplanes sp. ATCC 53533]